MSIAYEVEETYVAAQPEDLPAGWIAYNPSAMWTIPEGQLGAGKTVVYLRVEPDRSDDTISHLGVTESRPYLIDINNPEAPPQPFFEAVTVRGEDPQLTRVNRVNESGDIEKVWLLSVVQVEPNPDKPNEVKSLNTAFYWGHTLGELRLFAVGPPGEKDIRLSQAGDPETSTALHLYGRPQPRSGTGSPSYQYIQDGLQGINEDIIASAPYLRDEAGVEIFPIGEGTWGGVNEIISIDKLWNLLILHKARDLNRGKGIKDLYYTAEGYLHNHATGQIMYVGKLLEAKDFKPGKAKADTNVKTANVTFPGGPCDGKMDIITCGLRDHDFALARIVRVNPVSS